MDKNLEEIAVIKKLLLNQTCANCKTSKDKSGNNCYRFLGEAIGWQWWPMAEEGTCENWMEFKR